MGKLNIYYAKEFYNQYGKYAMMNPGTIKLGDVIDIDSFEVVGSLSDFGIKFTEIVVTDNPDARKEFKSKGVTIGELSVNNNEIGKIGITFGDDHSIFFSTKGCKITKIKEDNIGKNNLGNKIIGKYNRQEWQRNWLIVTEIEYTKKAIIIISNGKNANIELTTSGDCPVINELINANINFGKETSIGFRYQMPEKDYCSVLFKLKGVIKKPLLPPTFQIRKPAILIPDEDVVTTKIPNIEDILEPKEEDSFGEYIIEEATLRKLS